MTRTAVGHLAASLAVIAPPPNVKVNKYLMWTWHDTVGVQHIRGLQKFYPLMSYPGDWAGFSLMFKESLQGPSTRQNLLWTLMHSYSLFTLFCKTGMEKSCRITVVDRIFEPFTRAKLPIKQSNNPFTSESPAFEILFVLLAKCN